ncbi:hypothetical protein JXI42_01365 [bacterium]|nr:hypothetical protein [bacterium]
MEKTLLEYKIYEIEKELEKLKSVIVNSKRNNNKGFITLAGILKNETDLSLEEIKSFKYNAKGF